MRRDEFEKLVGPVRPNMIRFAMRSLRDQDEAEDIVQDTLLELHRNCKTFILGQGDGTQAASFETWCIGRLRWRVTDVLRERAKAPQMLSMDQFYADEMADNNLYKQPSQLIVKRDELAHDIRSAVSKLPNDVRRICELVYFEGYTQNEAAESLALSRDQVVRRLTNGHVFLRSLLADWISTKPIKKKLSIPKHPVRHARRFSSRKRADDQTTMDKSLFVVGWKIDESMMRRVEIHSMAAFGRLALTREPSLLHSKPVCRAR